MNNAYRLFDPSAGAYARANSDVRALKVRLFACPSYPGAETNEDETAARTTHAGCHNDQETPIDAKNNGLLFLNSKVRYTDILDGSSQTFLLGEYRAGEDELGWVSGTRATLRNTDRFDVTYHSRRNRLNKEEVPPVGPLTVGGFGSPHPGGAQFAFADGSSRFISEDTGLTVLHQLGNRADGKLLDADF